mmetsp:Transcript_17557/g.39533  ORF Transcript_17557/g.39533 Transcript_17557/m.39533 type:complete len:431 (+) Transcript_17557:70-1362(+)
MDPQIASQFTCPISLGVLEDPYLCTHCTASFSKVHAEAWLATHGQAASCPLCRGQWRLNDTLKRNTQLSNLLATLTAGGGATNAGDGMTFRFRQPYRTIVAGAFGSGKSTSLNKLVDPSGSTEVAREGNGGFGETQEMSAVFDGEVPFRDSTLKVVLYDTKGFNDPEQSDVDLLRQLSDGMLAVALGMDAIVHHVKMDRFTEGDIRLPNLLLDGLANSAAAKEELAQRWIIVVTKSDSDGDPVTLAEIEQFRGELGAKFPAELRPSVQRAIFIENGANTASPYANAEENRNRLLTQVVTARQVYHKSFVATNLDEVIASALEDTLRHQPQLSSALNSMDSQQLHALQQHFDVVNTSKAWIAITEAVPVPPAFRDAWNGLSIAVRDEVATQAAAAVHDEVRTRCKAKLASEIEEALARQKYGPFAKYCLVQ